MPLLKQLMNYTGKIASVVILRQDKKVVISQLPKKSGSKIGENLIMGDIPIVEYRKHRQELIDSHLEDYAERN